MTESIIFCIVAVTTIIALFLAWFFYQKARDKERIYLIERGDSFSDILKAQKENRIIFLFPWSKLAIVTLSLSIAFSAISFLVLYLENDKELFKGFLITAIIGICLSISFFIILFLSKKKE